MAFLRILSSLAVLTVQLSVAPTRMMMFADGLEIPDRPPIECGNGQVGWETLEEDCANVCTRQEFISGIYSVGPTKEDSKIYRQMDCN